MTDLTGYSTEQALARDLLSAAVHGHISDWARVHGFTVDCPPEQVHAEGIETSDRSLWAVDLADMTKAISKLIDQPLDCGDPGFVKDTGMLTFVGQALAVARDRHVTRVADLAPAEPVAPDFDHDNFEHLVTDVVFQVAVAGEVIH